MDVVPVRRTARFLFLTDDSGSVPWCDGPEQGRGRVGWRLVAANNRPLGRSTETFRSLGDCVTAAIALHRQADALVPSIDFVAESSRWGWTVCLGATPVAVCVHRYRRRIECTRALRQFLSAVAQIEPVGDNLRHLGRYALGVYDRSADDAEPMVRSTRLVPRTATA